MKYLKKLAALAVSIFMVLSLVSCQSVDESSSDKSANTTDPYSHNHSSNSKGTFKDGVYTNDEYSIELGSGWEQAKDTTDSDIAMFSHGSNSFSNINVRRECHDKANEIDVEQYKETTANQFNSLKDYKVTKTKDVEIDGKKAFKVYINMNSGDTKMKLIQCYIIADKDIYVCSFLTSAEEYKKMKSEGEKIIDTFKFR